eukprot:4947558-Amphidinium_carterae.1
MAVLPRPLMCHVCLGLNLSLPDPHVAIMVARTDRQAEAHMGLQDFVLGRALWSGPTSQRKVVDGSQEGENIGWDRSCVIRLL